MALLASVQKDLRWRLADPAALVLWIGIPLVLGGLMGLVFSGGGIQGRGELLVVDEDDTIVTNLIAQAASGGGLIRVEKVKLTEGRQRIDAGDASGLLVIPKGFSQALLDNAPTSLDLTLNPSQQIFPKMIQAGAEILVDGEFYLQQLGGDLLKDLSRMQPSGNSAIVDSLLVGAYAVKFNNRLKSLEPVLIPPVLRVEDELTDAQKAAASAAPAPQTNFGILLFPGILFMSLMFMAQGIAYDIWREKDQGTLARLVCSPVGATTFLFAKAISGAVSMGVVALVGLVVGYAWFGLPAAAIPLALGWIVFSGTTLLVLFFVVMMLARSATGGSVLSSVLLFPLMMIGGSFMPFEAMPGVMSTIGEFTPNGLAVTQLAAVLKGSWSGADLLAAAGWLGLSAAVFFAVAIAQIRSRFVLV